jgi:hypothetical protein
MLAERAITPINKIRSCSLFCSIIKIVRALFAKAVLIKAEAGIVNYTHLSPAKPRGLFYRFRDSIVKCGWLREFRDILERPKRHCQGMWRQLLGRALWGGKISSSDFPTNDYR